MKEYVCTACYDKIGSYGTPCYFIVIVPLNADDPKFCPYGGNCKPNWRRVDKYDE